MKANRIILTHKELSVVGGDKRQAAVRAGMPADVSDFVYREQRDGKVLILYDAPRVAQPIDPAFTSPVDTRRINKLIIPPLSASGDCPEDCPFLYFAEGEGFSDACCTLGAEDDRDYPRIKPTSRCPGPGTWPLPQRDQPELQECGAVRTPAHDCKGE